MEDALVALAAECMKVLDESAGAGGEGAGDVRALLCRAFKGDLRLLILELRRKHAAEWKRQLGLLVRLVA